MAANGEAGPRTILCIDDDDQTVELLKLMLEKHGFEGLGAASGQDGLDLIASEHPDLVLLDLRMPEMGGWDVFQRMKADETMRNIPVIIVTCMAQPIDETLARHIAKVDDYVTKPFSPSRLVARIDKVLSASDGAVS